MNLMLTVIFLCVALGLLAPRPGKREYLAIVLLATTMTGLYFFVHRFM
jgi:hypothetical protein